MKKRQALVVGINLYPFGENQNLAQPAEDAEAVARLLEQHGDFEVERLPCQDGVQRVDSEQVVSLEQLEEAIIRLFHPRSGMIPETALLFFAGHGWQRKNNGETEGFLVTSDALLEEDGEDYGLFSLKRLRQLLQDSPVRQQIVWLDCCHSGELFNFTETDLGEEKRGRDRCFIAAAREFQVAYGGVLTPALLQGLDPTNQPDGWVTNYSLTDFIKQGLKDAPQHSACRNTGGQIILTGKQGVLANICPYKGLEFFDFNPEEAENAEDPKYFYGRTELTEKLWKKVRSSNFLALLGASGSGKSSVVRAGLLYQLYLGEKIRGSDRWKIYKPFTPSEHPLRSLEQVVGVKAEQLEPLIKAAAAERVVLVVDQFEEVFTQCRDEAERQQFFKCLMGAVERLGNKLCLVLAMRSDFQGKCDEYPELATKIDQDLVRVMSMSQEELREAITKPSERVDLVIDRELVNQMIADVSGSPGDLPLMQYTLTELWEQRTLNRLTISDYTRLGGVKKALENHANEVYKFLSTEEQLVAKRIFLELTRLGEETEDTRQQVRQQDLVNSQQSQGLVEQVIQKLTAARAKLVVTSEQELGKKRVAVVNIAHEALIRNWQRLRDWLKENRDALLRKQDIEDAAKEWRDKGKPNDSAYLLQGQRLADAENFCQSYADTVPLSGVAQEFVQESIKERRSSYCRIAVIVTGVILGLSGLAGWALVENENAQIRNLSANSEALFKSNQELDALIEAIKASKRLKRPSGAIGAKADTRIRVLTALQRVVYGTRERHRLEGHTNEVNTVSFSPDGKTLASASSDATIKLWSIEGRELATLEGHSDKVYSVSFSPDGKTLASAGKDKTIKLWSLEGKELATLKGHSMSINNVSFSPDSKILASAGVDNIIKLWSVDGKELATLKGHSAPVVGVSFSPDGKTLASASRDTTIKLWSLEGKEIATLKGHSGEVYSVSFSPDGKLLASGGSDGIKLWNLERKELLNFQGYGDFVYNLSFSPDGKKLTMVGGGKGIKVLNLDTWEVTTFEGHIYRVNAISFSPDGRTLASASEDNTIKLWSLNGEELTRVKGDTGAVESISFSPDGKTLAASSRVSEPHSFDKIIKLWSREGKEIATLNDDSFSFRFSPDGKILASNSDDNTIKLWRLDGTQMATLQEHSFSFSPDGKNLATGGADGTIKLWSLDGKQLASFKRHSKPINSVSFSPNGKTLATASDDNTIQLWSLNGKQLATFKGGGVSFSPDASFSPDGKILATNAEDGIKLWNLEGKEIATLKGDTVSFSPDGKTIATTTDRDSTIKLWRRDGKELVTLQGHNSQIWSISFSPDGKLLASTGRDEGVIKLWSLDGTEIATLEGHNGFTQHISFSPDGKTLASADGDGTILFWNFDLDNLLMRGCNFVHDYLNNSKVNISQENRRLCDGIGTSH